MGREGLFEEVASKHKAVRESESRLQKQHATQTQQELQRPWGLRHRTEQPEGSCGFSGRSGRASGRNGGWWGNPGDPALNEAEFRVHWEARARL